jgi:hypothetical protein
MCPGESSPIKIVPIAINTVQHPLPRRRAVSRSVASQA